MQVYRVYYDRLVDSADRQWLFELMQKMVKQHFKEDFQALFKHLNSSGGKVVDDNMRSLLFGDYTKPEAVSGWVWSWVGMGCGCGMGLWVCHGAMGVS